MPAAWLDACWTLVGPLLDPGWTPVGPWLDPGWTWSRHWIQFPRGTPGKPFPTRASFRFRGAIYGSWTSISMVAGGWGKKQSASRSFERLALGRTYESYISVRKGCSKGCPSHSKPLSVHSLLHRCPVGAACPCLARRGPVGGGPVLHTDVQSVCCPVYRE